MQSARSSSSRIAFADHLRLHTVRQNDSSCVVGSYPVLRAQRVPAEDGTRNKQLNYVCIGQCALIACMDEVHDVVCNASSTAI